MTQEVWQATNLPRTAEEEREFQVSKKILSVLRTYQSIRVHPDVFHSADFDIDYNTIRLMTEKNLLTDHLADDHYHGYTYHEWPATTWQMFKKTHNKSWWLRWLVKLRPVKNATQRKMVEIEVKRYLAYPDAVIDSTKLGRHMIWEDVRRVGADD